MSYVIDRRLNGKNKSMVNRQRFLQRYRGHIKKAVEEAVSRRSITDMEHGEQISIPGRDIDEPVLHHGRGGRQTVVHPGNKEFVAGERIPRPQGGGGSGGGQGKASNSGEGIDDFVFQITQEEFLDFMFEDLELPNLVKRHLTGADTFKTVRAGISSEGNPSRINIVRTLRSAHARRIALSGSSRGKLREAKAELERLKREEPDNLGDIKACEEEILRLRARIERVPFLDTFDLKYNLLVKHPNPSSKAVMFCLMDVSGSMTQATKDVAKRFFILLYLFLKRNYDKIDVVFIRHHTSAKEVDEEEFFYSRETGGTIVSSALKMMQEIMAERYPAAEWNIYGAQASDGDNWNDDSPLCRDILINQIMPFVQYFTYVEITPREHQALWYEYNQVSEAFPEAFAQQQLVSASDIYPVFRELFQRRLSAGRGAA
ncbi:YeaH/YhbH family protein [Pseudomonas oligotrophica]|uniref:YeaH/YhbH family protein n=1 Tax=Pseudomonas oligotrophica TaxID=2912055 RepID=UPI001F435B21|nr:YeaH/YhbH family protein [Pseudomonas oligotrophica]MCF7201512.1 YeaH/YhbH family protein [Pseudomonas oligotrophica]